MRKRLSVFLTALVIPAGVRAANPPLVRVGYAPNITHATGIVGFCPEKQSYYKAFPGVNFDNRVFTTGPAAVAALRAGTMDMAFMGAGPAIVAFGQKRDVVILANTASGGILLVARKNSGVRSAADLKGRRVAVPSVGDTQDVLVRYQLALNGLRATDRGGTAAILPIENAATARAFQRKGADAACLPEPWASRLQREEDATVILTPTQIFNSGTYPTTVLVARRDFAVQNPDFVRRFAAATNVITRSIAANPTGYVPILRSEVKRLSGVSLSETVIRSGVMRTRFTTKIDQHEIAVFANLVELAGYRTVGQSLDGILWR